ncbi:serine/threonine-protein phosphatase 6 regulatory ankyrin repeat subunit B-like isoform X2 [Littorina saxatilis]|uniref:Uncharacterized protein n=1 Tax=Littorina saxatilis TaxID=31220 RepID=A0AAN9G8E5_9CAEN
MAGIASKLHKYIKQGDGPKVQQLLGGITDAVIIGEIERSFQETDPVNLAINCREEHLAIYLVEKGFSVTKLYQSVTERCDQWCLSHHRNGRCPSQYDSGDNAASKHFHRLKELIEAIRDGRRKPGDGLTSSLVLNGLVPHPSSEKKAKPDRDRLLAPGVNKENPKSAAFEAVGLLETYGATFVDKDGSTLLHRVSNSTPAHIYVLANRGVPVNVQSNDGDTALHLAVRNDNFECAEALIQCSADLTVRNGMGQMPGDEAEGPLKEMLERCRCGVVAAFETGHPKLLSHLLGKTWASLSTIVKDGKNLIQLAMSISSDSPEIMNCCRILQEYRNTSELVHAVLSEDIKKLEQFFVDHRGYSVNIRFRDQYGKTLLSHAIDGNNYEVVQMLVTAGARVNQIRVRDKGRGPETVPLFFKALSKDINPDITQFLHSVQDASEMLEKDTRGNTAILRAIEEGASEQIISWLLATQNGLNVTHRNKDSRNARELADYYGRQEIVNLIDKFVLQQRKKFFLINLPVHFYGLDNLHFVDEHTGKSFEEVILDGRDEDDRKSISHYKDIENRGISLFEAAARGDMEQVQRLSVANFQDKNGYTALIRAIVFNQPEVAKYLCTSRPVLKSIPDNCNRYPLHYACALPDGQDKTFVKILLERNPELIEKKMDKDGKYPVEYRSMRGSPAILQKLLDARTLDAYGDRGPPLGPWPEEAQTTEPTSEE